MLKSFQYLLKNKRKLLSTNINKIMNKARKFNDIPFNVAPIEYIRKFKFIFITKYR